MKLYSTGTLGTRVLPNSVADPHHFDADAETDPDPTFHFDAVGS
jgi:hypothetical protein